MNVILPDGSQKELPDGASGADLAAAIGPGLARAALAVKVGGEVRDLARPLADGDEVAIVTNRYDESLDLIRHDTAHVLAAAVIDLYPGTKISIGPPIEDGFYYDFEFPEGVTVSDADFERLEAKMREHVKAAEAFEREDVSPAAARERFVGEGQDYKVELIDDLVANNGVDSVSLYTNGPFTDLCRGPHAPSTDRIKAFKLLSVAGAYWRGNSDNTMLTRIYGTAFHSKEDLEAHLERLEQARQRDHRKLGRELGPVPLLRARPPAARSGCRSGTAVYNTLVARSREMSLARGYEEVKTPLLYDRKLWEISGHWGKYRENMFVTESEDHPMALKPMNCPGHARSTRWASTPTASSRSATPSPASCTATSRAARCTACCASATSSRTTPTSSAPRSRSRTRCSPASTFGFDWYDLFGFDMRIELSTRPENRIGTDELWDHTEGTLEAALKRGGYEYEINEGDGAFYAPKIDLHMRDSLGRSWQLGTVQLDYNFPERFDLTYTGADNAEHQPVMIHRALVGSFERFIGILLEQTGGELPLWLAPVQAARAAAGRPPQRLRPGGRRRAARRRPARATSTTAPSRSGARSARPSCRRCRSCSWSATARPTSRAAALRRHGEGDLGTLPLDEAVRADRGRGRRLRLALLAGLFLALAAPAHASTAMVVIVDSCGSDVACNKYDGGHGVPVVDLPRRGAESRTG